MKTAATYSCDRCNRPLRNIPGTFGKFRPSQVRNPDGRLGYYFICRDCIASGQTKAGDK